MRLNQQCEARLPALVRRPRYDRRSQKIGIVHLGIGAFHRAHQAAYTHNAMDQGDRNWAIAGVSLRSQNVRNALAPQDGLYIVAERSADGENLTLASAVRQVLAARREANGVLDLLASPDTHIVTLTVSERGYVRGADGALDHGNSELASELAGGEPRTIYGFLTEGLRRRRERGLGGLSIISCDNLARNGAQLSALLRHFLDRIDADLARWIEIECAFPCTMVDRIVPATTPDDLDHIEAVTGVRDEAAVITEPFTQWILEDRFAGPRPRWETGGAVFVRDVHAYEAAKLRMLNGAHSALAYLGLARGYRHVHEAVCDPEIASLLRDLMADAAASLPSGGPDPHLYAHELLARFANPALPHRLSQIAKDGSQKIPQRWLEVMKANCAAARPMDAHIRALAAWIAFTRGDDHQVDDPCAEALGRLWATHGAGQIAGALLGEGGFFAATWTAPTNVLEAVSRQLLAEQTMTAHRE